MSESLSSQANNSFSQGSVAQASDTNFQAALLAALDYRGDVTLTLSDSSQIEGYIFNVSSQLVQLYPKGTEGVKDIKRTDIITLAFSGKDTAAGQSWEDWTKKKALQKNSQENTHSNSSSSH